MCNHSKAFSIKPTGPQPPRPISEKGGSVKVLTTASDVAVSTYDTGITGGEGMEKLS